METRVIIAGIATTTGIATGQGQITPGSVQYSVSMVEYNLATMLPSPIQDNDLNVGEAAMLRITMQYAPANGTPVTYPTTLLVGCSGAGTMGGFWNGTVDLGSSGGAEGQWLLTGGSGAHRRGLQPPFNIGAGHGTPYPAGTGVANIMPAQFGASIDTLSTANNVLVWQGLWTPSSYAFRIVTFRTMPSSLGTPEASLWAADNHYTSGFDLPVPGTVPATHGSVQFTIAIPSPGGVLLLAACGLPLAHRRRRG